MMKLLGKAEILEADDRPFEDVPTPEFGEGTAVRIRTMSGAQRDQWERGLTQAVPDGVDEQGQPKTKITYNLDNVRARLVALSAVDEQGEPLFTSAEDVIALGKKSFIALGRLTASARRMNKLEGDDMEDEVKKSEASPA